jgi:hypothetical protein
MTAVEFLKQNLPSLFVDDSGHYENLFQQALEMEEQQIEKMYSENCCTPIGQIKRYMNCVGCDRKPKQETLVEAAEKYSGLQAGTFTPPHKTTYKHGFEFGAKWQQERMYSEEDLKEAFRSNYTPFSATNTGDFDEDFDRWFEQFKKDKL